MIKIALDAMGGDNAPHDVVHGGIEAARLSKGRFEVVLVGDKEKIEKEVARHFMTADLPYSVVHAADTVAMDMQPSQALRQKESSIAVSFRLHKEKKVSAVVSAGNTGAVMATALMQLKRIKSIRRPAIGMLVPSETGKTLLIDVGANVDSRPADLLQFGIMGSIFFSHVFSREKPAVGLLSVGHEASKGNDMTLKANILFKNSNLNFIGNIEGGDIVKGNADIVVCDGYVGNILLKFAESFHGLFKANMRRFIRKYLFSKIGALMMKPTFEGIRKAFDYQEYGGAPLLGVQGYCIIAHGRSTPRAIKNAILAAHKTVIENVAGHIHNDVDQLAAIS